jgi:hypothetical protein
MESDEGVPSEVQAEHRPEFSHFLENAFVSRVNRRMRRTNSDILPGNVRKLNLAVTAVCLLLPGCHERSDLDRLVAAGATACATASEYYDQLGAMTVEACKTRRHSRRWQAAQRPKNPTTYFNSGLTLWRGVLNWRRPSAMRMVPLPHCARRAD